MITHNKNYHHIRKIDGKHYWPEDIKDKQNVDKEDFAFKVLEEINGTKYMYLSLLYGAVEAVSHKYQIFCAEDLEVFMEYLIPVVENFYNYNPNIFKEEIN